MVDSDLLLTSFLGVPLGIGRGRRTIYVFSLLVEESLSERTSSAKQTF
jgi:hypothetical protein